MKRLTPIKGKHIGCLNCGGNESKLPMRSLLYSGFGGWYITKDGEHYFEEKVNLEFNENKTLSYIERRAKLEPEADWRAIVFLPLRGATYQRQGKSNWVLVEENEGFV